MVSTKDLRDIFDDLKSEATKRAGRAISESNKRAARAINETNIGRRSGPPGLLVLGLGLVLGAIIGMVGAILASPYSGTQARAKITERVEKMRRQHQEAETNGATHDAPINSFERP
jgi:CHASE3 domain sensor protein